MDQYLKYVARMTTAAEMAIGAHANLYLAAFLSGDELAMAHETKAALEATARLLSAKLASARPMFPDQSSVPTPVPVDEFEQATVTH